ncbi:MAG: 4-hydroxy-4-methyl-2-oxoglutarate aldolase [Streptosporangiaceae bacterium]|jgi:4-hydroxy-4-methyl-2-oxoglutarate aldolase|nr:4-hydroxy-4-methyl-2-oxoglutarate aldolase [Streptosporangiaceae bacterium]
MTKHPLANTTVSDALLALGSATLGESGGQGLHARIHAMWPGARFAGPAFTVRCPVGDNLAVHAAVAQAPRGSVLAVTVAGDGSRGYWGEVLATAAQAAGIVALVIDGTVRDLDRLAALEFPVFARGHSLPGASKSGPGEVGGSIALGDVTVRSGDWLVGDTDGIVAVNPEALDDVIAAAQAREAKELGMFDRLRAGATTVELLGLDVSSIRGA